LLLRVEPAVRAGAVESFSKTEKGAETTPLGWEIMLPLSPSRSMYVYGAESSDTYGGAANLVVQLLKKQLQFQMHSIWEKNPGD
jgi:hypothetical protein